MKTGTIRWGKQRRCISHMHGVMERAHRMEMAERGLKVRVHLRLPFNLEITDVISSGKK